jgi:hypothetical protein
VKRILFHQIAVALSLYASLIGNNAFSADAPSRASNMSAISEVVSVAAVPYFFSEAGEYLVKSVEASGKGTVYVLEKVGTSVRGSVTISANTSGAVSVGVGDGLKVTATSAGMLLVSAGQVLAIIPTELGKSLMESKKISS